MNTQETESLLRASKDIMEWWLDKFQDDRNVLYENLMVAVRSCESQKYQFKLGERVEKRSGSSWRGKIVGFYTTKLTPIGYAVESEFEPGAVQIYPESALIKSLDCLQEVYYRQVLI